MQASSNSKLAEPMKKLPLLMIVFFLHSPLLLAQDTTCGIVWEPPIQLSPGDPTVDEQLPSIAVQGDTVHVTWQLGGQRFPYRRSVNEGHTFEPIRELAPDSITLGTGGCFVAAHGRTLFGWFGTDDYGGGVGNDGYLMISTDRGNAWTMPGSRLDSTSWVAYDAFEDTLVLVDAKFNDGWHIRFTTNGGITWTRRDQQLSYTPEYPAIALTPGALHKAVPFSFDSAGVHSNFVIQYRKSSDMGLTWTDSVNLSPITSTSLVFECAIAADGTGDSARVISAWRDTRNGCLTLVGCGIYGRTSHTTGDMFEPERRLDIRPSGYSPFTSVHYSVMSVVWIDDLAADRGVRVRVSRDGGSTWCLPFAVLTGFSGGRTQIAVSPNAVHVVYYQLLGQRWRVFYRRGVLPTTGVKEPTYVQPPYVSLSQSYPNPFNPRTKIVYRVESREFVQLKVYDILGREVAELVNGLVEAGEHTVEWNAEGMPSGVYCYRLTTRSSQHGVSMLTNKMILIR